MISSAANDKYKLWHSLLDSKGIKKHGLFLLFGDKVVNETLSARRHQVETLLSSEKHSSAPGEILSAELFRQLDIFGTDSPIAVCRCPEIPTWKKTQAGGQISGLTLLCPLGDPANLGALIRTASAFDVKALVLLKEAANPFHPRSVRAASGSLFSLPLYRGPSIKDLNDWRLTDLFALDGGGKDLRAFHWPVAPLLLVGEEGPGIPPDLLCEKIAIPLKNNVESLNATVAAAIALSHFSFSQKN